ncbi:hypothetical protein [uncultured Desulfobacter sp.]|uniref:hypothetical protein n=1 Tax=uncultured Desulfobacter sp. TaxID=240139 RepID=UPI002AAC3137|nr:hypothetical protein [uncultured Desulfobacter sp.]
MTTNIPIIYGSEIIAQASAAITADDDSDGVLTTIDNSLSGNGAGCHMYQCFVNVTSGPTSDAVCRLYYAGARSGTPSNFDSGSLSVAIPAAGTGDFSLGYLDIPDPVSRCKIAAENYGFTASLIVVPVLPQAQ